MDAPREEVEIPMPLNSAYPGAHVHGHVSNMFHQHHYHDEKSQTHLQVSSSNGPLMPITLNHDHHDYEHVRYRECMKNHAASMGGNVTDGCGEFMPSGGEGTIEALTCSVCNCHRNFHRKQVEGDEVKGRKVINLGHHKNMNMLLSPARVNGMVGVGGYPTTRAVPIIPYNMGSLLVCSDQSDGQDEGGGGGAAAGVPASGGSGYMGFPPPTSSQYHSNNQMLKKRFRTKFTAEQKEKMFNFAEKIGWTIQKQEESAIQHFCHEIGVKRKVLKVWMHNNKHILNKKNSPNANGGSEEKHP